MEQWRDMVLTKSKGTKGKGKGADIFLSFYLFHIWLNRVKAHQIFIYCASDQEKAVTFL